MSKITEKELRKTALKLLPAIYSDAMQTGEESGLFQHEDWRTGLCLDAFLLADAFEKAAAYRNTEPKPQLKTLDQSVFDGKDERLSLAAIESDGRAFLFEPKAEFRSKSEGWSSFGLCRLIGTGYDASNWRNSLIKRDDIAKKLAEVDLNSELTGSDLARAMLARGDRCVMCFVANNEANMFLATRPVVVHGFTDSSFISVSGCYSFAVPVNTQGEPLTASEVGL